VKTVHISNQYYAGPLQIFDFVADLKSKVANFNLTLNPMEKPVNCYIFIDQTNIMLA
jgi:hypothetical protein